MPFLSGLDKVAMALSRFGGFTQAAEFNFRIDELLPLSFKLSMRELNRTRLRSGRFAAVVGMRFWRTCAAVDFLCAPTL